MTSGEDPTTTRLLRALRGGDAEASDELARRVYGELHRIAGAALARAAARDALTPTTLVHEAWIRVAGLPASYEHRRQFFALAARVMRSVLVDHARARGAHKRGGDARRIALADDAGLTRGGEVDFLALHEALERLRTLDETLHQMVELRFFAGLGHEEIARLTGASLSTVERRWRLARAWLRGELGP